MFQILPVEPKSEVRTSVKCVISNVTYDFISSKTLENLAFTESMIFSDQYQVYHKYEKDIRYGNKMTVPHGSSLIW